MELVPHPERRSVEPEPTRLGERRWSEPLHDPESIAGSTVLPNEGRDGRVRHHPRDAPEAETREEECVPGHCHDDGGGERGPSDDDLAVLSGGDLRCHD